MTRQNGISVEDMLKLQVMEACNLIAGFRGVRNTISRVNIMADPDVLNWTKEGEFLLTTAYSFKEDDTQSQMELIKECSAKGLAGIGIKISPYLNEISLEVLALANDLSFPIIDIHSSIPLSDIMQATFKEIFNKQASLLERLERVHEQLMNTMLEGKGLKDLVEIIKENIRNPVLLHLNFSNTIIQCFDEIKACYEPELLREVHDFYEKNNSRNRLRKLVEERVLINGKFVKMMIVPIVVKDNLYGHIFTWGINTPLGGFDLSIMESASTTIALSILQELSLKEVEIRYRSEFFEDLISKDIRRRKKALDRARFFNLPYENYYVIEVISFKYRDEPENADPIIDYLQDFINPIVNNIEELMRYYKLEGIVSTKGNGLQILLSFCEDKQILERLGNLNDKIIECILKRCSNLEPRIGVGRVYNGLDNVEKSFQDALKAVRMGKVITPNPIITFDELGIYKILSQDSLKEELEDFYNSTLKPLADYDDKKSTELVKTLESYFENNGNLTRISEQLYTHYNTILYRITRISEITKMDLEDPNHRLSLEIGIKIKELLRK